MSTWNQLMIHGSLESRVGFKVNRLSIRWTQNIEDSFETKKAGTVFIYRPAAFDTVWHRGLT